MTGPGEVSLGLAFVAGVLSILSPCTLAMLPAYVGYITRVSFGEEARGRAPSAGRTALSAALFMAGFSAVFIGLGASASALGQFLLTSQAALRKVAGLVVIVFGLHTAGLFRLGFLERERRVAPGAGATAGSPLHAVWLGMAFSAGWTPCIGPILASILALASTTAGVEEGVGLLAAYSAGMGLPFLLIALSLDRFRQFLPWLRRRARAIEVASGLFLVAMGVMLYTNFFFVLPQYFNYYRLFQ